MILYQSLDFNLVPSDLFVPKKLPGVFGYGDECHYSIVRRVGAIPCGCPNRYERAELARLPNSGTYYTLDGQSPVSLWDVLNRYF